MEIIAKKPSKVTTSAGISPVNSTKISLFICVAFIFPIFFGQPKFKDIVRSKIHPPYGVTVTPNPHSGFILRREDGSIVGAFFLFRSRIPTSISSPRAAQGTTGRRFDLLKWVVFLGAFLWRFLNTPVPFECLWIGFPFNPTLPQIVSHKNTKMPNMFNVSIHLSKGGCFHLECIFHAKIVMILSLQRWVWNPEYGFYINRSLPTRWHDIGDIDHESWVKACRYL